MSEYQFYEFKSIDKPLTPTEKETISSWSSRTQATNSGAVFIYQYSDFSQKELEVVRNYFDAMFYIANWGSRRLIFKIPINFVDLKKIKAYCVEGLEVYEYDQFILIDIWLNDEETGYDWIEGEGMLSTLLPLRKDIISGDYRCLYLIWLKISAEDVANEYGEVDPESMEPEVPSGLSELNSSLNDFVDVFGIDKDLIAAAAEISPSIKSKTVDYSSLISDLSDKEKNSWLLRLLNGEPLLSEKLKRNIWKDTPKQKPSSGRMVYDIVEAARKLLENRLLAEKNEQLKKRLIYLEKIEAEKDNLWRQVFSLIPQKKTKAYEEAVEILISLKELAIHQNDFEEFKYEVEELKQQYSKLSGLKSRIDQARLLKTE